MVVLLEFLFKLFFLFEKPLLILSFCSNFFIQFIERSLQRCFCLTLGMQLQKEKIVRAGEMIDQMGILDREEFSTVSPFHSALLYELSSLHNTDASVLEVRIGDKNSCSLHNHLPSISYMTFSS